MGDKATDTLREAFHYGHLPLWRIHEGREVPVAPAVLERNNVKYGIFKSHERPEPDMQGAKLWVKHPDWQAFLARTVVPDPTHALLPPDAPFVTLSEALTWIAFGVAMNFELVSHLLLMDRYGGQVPQEALQDAVRRLAAHGSGGTIAMRGKYRESHQVAERVLATTPIESVKFHDFRLYNELHDALEHGEGMFHWSTPEGTVSRNGHGGRSDSFRHVIVDRADLLREFPAHLMRNVTSSVPDYRGPILWDDFPEESLPELRRLCDMAARDEWWSWPEAVAWVGSRDAKNIASLRFWGRSWAERGGGDATVTLGALAYIATQYCPPELDAEGDLMNAIQRGHVLTSGRLSKGAIASDLSPSIWRGGKVIYHEGEAVQADAKHKLTAWAFDIAVRRADVMSAFPETLIELGRIDI